MKLNPVLNWKGEESSQSQFAMPEILKELKLEFTANMAGKINDVITIKTLCNGSLIFNVQLCMEMKINAA